MAIHTHVIDSAQGRPAVGVGIRLERRGDTAWDGQTTGSTGIGGLVVDWSPRQVTHPPRGVYRLTFDVGRYFAALGIAPLFPEVTVVFPVSDPDEDFHLTLLLGSQRTWPSQQPVTRRSTHGVRAMPNHRPGDRNATVDR